MALWPSLPAELRLEIFELLAQDRLAHFHFGSYAVVSHEWLAFFEPKNFRRLSLRLPCLDDLDRMVNIRQREFVEHIRLDIGVERYNCQSCGTGKSESCAAINSDVARRAILKLFSILSTWEPNRGGRGLKLEISAYSPKDSQLLGPKHGWLDGHDISTSWSLETTLPEVQAVTKFVIHPHCRRHFCASYLGLLLDKLPRLECLVYEPWYPLLYDSGYKTLIEAHLPKGLRALTVFELDPDHLVFEYPDPGHLKFLRRLMAGRAPVQDATALGAAFACRSLELEHLDVTFNVDAEQFFDAREPLWTWDNLRSLVLTSQLLTPMAEPLEINGMLENAAAAALCMPKLETMYVWNGAKREACAFVYYQTYETGHPTIIWRGTWNHGFVPRVIQAWEGVASKRNRSKLRLQTQYLDPDDVDSRAMSMLDLPCGVVRW
ncbi:hypothetical protein CONLIGDRAFT_644443 [Coniochaeta ligniaria NRRL 30616]|uniref:DUF6546 domain-containing protein n=1 Tax=Coniochaeta ligniaria NRRL 30616 TaxID=1408157 RepID=A0A1J7J4M3_9PEZI|nr:hypothetical protein CONLIGDRAFT_644443 [Coniochaeta ligniaria NRRL 30616]